MSSPDELTRQWAQAVESELLARRRRLSGLKPNLRRARGRIAVVTDSASSLPVDRSRSTAAVGTLGAHITVVPIPVMIDHPHPAAQMYPEASEELERDLALAVAQGIPVRTSRPSPGRFADAYRDLQRQGFAGIVSIHLSSKLSGTVDAARLAAGQVDIAVQVIDSHQAGLALGETVIEAAMAARLGAGMAETVQRAQQVAQGCRSFFVVPNLEQLRRGGRINRMASLLGTMMGVKPVLGLDGGEVVLLERPRSLSRAVDRLCELAQAEAAGHEHPRMGVLCFGNPDQATSLAERIQPYSATPVPVLPLPPGLGAHLGLGALAVSVAPGS